MLGRPLFSLFSHAAARVQDCAALIMRAVAQGGATAAAPMREAALKEGAMLHHLLTATSGQVNHIASAASGQVNHRAIAASGQPQSKASRSAQLAACLKPAVNILPQHHCSWLCCIMC